MMYKVKSSDGTAIAVYRSGQGAPLVLIHGSSSGFRRWASVLPMLEEQFTVYRMERRGRGESGDTEDYTINKEIEDITAVLQSISGRVNVLAHSYGAICTLEAVTGIDHLNRLILYEPPIPTGTALHPPGVIRRIQHHIDAGELEEAYCIFAREALQRPEEELERLRRLPAWSVYLSMLPTLPREMTEVDRYRFDPERFRQLHVPVLLMLGGDSPPLFAAALDRVTAALPDSRTLILPGQEHIAMDTAPRLFAGEVVSFFTA
jgi:pimeloyl-ACP methyl ester carboxylesterase